MLDEFLAISALNVQSLRNYCTFRAPMNNSWTKMLWRWDCFLPHVDHANLIWYFSSIYYDLFQRLQRRTSLLPSSSNAKLNNMSFQLNRKQNVIYQQLATPHQLIINRGKTHSPQSTGVLNATSPQKSYRLQWIPSGLDWLLRWSFSYFWYDHLFYKLFYFWIPGSSVC